MRRHGREGSKEGADQEVKNPASRHHVGGEQRADDL